MPKAAIISKPQKPELNEILHDLVPWLESHGFEAFLDSESASYFGPDGPSTSRADLHRHNPDVVIVLGGDGTLLSASAPSPTPPPPSSPSTLALSASSPRPPSPTSTRPSKLSSPDAPTSTSAP